MKKSTFIKVGPADCMVFTRRPYHQMAPHLTRLWGLPIRSIGVDIMSGTKRTKRYTKRFAVSKGSHMLSFRNVSKSDFDGVGFGYDNVVVVVAVAVVVCVGVTYRTEKGSNQIACLRREKRERVKKRRG